MLSEGQSRRRGGTTAQRDSDREKTSLCHRTAKCRSRCSRAGRAIRFECHRRLGRTHPGAACQQPQTTRPESRQVERPVDRRAPLRTSPSSPAERPIPPYPAQLMRAESTIRRSPRLPGAPQRAPRLCASVLAALQHLHAIHEHVRHADRVLVRRLEGRAIGDRRRIEDDDIRE